MKIKKSNFLKTACILNIVCGALLVISSVYLLSLLQTGTVLLFICLLFGVIIVTLSTVILTETRIYGFIKAMSITLFVLDIIITVGYLLSFFTVIYLLHFFLSFILASAYILSAIFLMIDVVKNSSNQKHISDTITNKSQDEFNEFFNETPPQKNKQAAFLDELVKLQQMKETGMITESEFKSLKSKIIERY